MRLFIEIAKDEIGNRAYHYAVIGGTVEGHDITVEAPEDWEWPTADTRSFQEVSEEAGPPRYLPTGDSMAAIREMDRLIKEHGL